MELFQPIERGPAAILELRDHRCRGLVVFFWIYSFRFRCGKHLSACTAAQPFERVDSGGQRRLAHNPHQHFVAYFSELIRLKLGRRLRSASTIEDVRQETFTRVWAVLRNEHGVREPERLGAFVNSVCNNVLREHYCRASKEVPSGDEAGADVPDAAIGAVDVVANGQMQRKVRQVLQKLSERDRLLLEHVFLEERDKDEVCRDFGVNRDYLRVLLHRARRSFRALLLRERKAHSGELRCPAATPLTV